jgi:hypothetical protein
MDLPPAPIMFAKPRTALAGPGVIRVPKAGQDEQLDFETELAIVIGKNCRDVSQEDALDYVLGWVVPYRCELANILTCAFQSHRFQRCIVSKGATGYQSMVCHLLSYLDFAS